MRDTQYKITTLNIPQAPDSHLQLNKKRKFG